MNISFQNFSLPMHQHHGQLAEAVPSCNRGLWKCVGYGRGGREPDLKDQEGIEQTFIWHLFDKCDLRNCSRLLEHPHSGSDY